MFEKKGKLESISIILSYAAKCPQNVSIESNQSCFVFYLNSKKFFRNKYDENNGSLKPFFTKQMQNSQNRIQITLK